MDPDEVYHGSGGQRNDNHRGMVSREVALPNSSRRAAARRARKQQQQQAEGGGSDVPKDMPGGGDRGEEGVYYSSSGQRRPPPSSSRHKSREERHGSSHHGSSRHLSSSRQHHSSGHRRDSDREASDRERSHHRHIDLGRVRSARHKHRDERRGSDRHKHDEGSSKHGHKSYSRKSSDESSERIDTKADPKAGEEDNKEQYEEEYEEELFEVDEEDVDIDIEEDDDEIENIYGGNSDLIEYDHPNEDDAEAEFDEDHDFEEFDDEDEFDGLDEVDHVNEDDIDGLDYEPEENEFSEEIEEADYNEHCGDTTVAPKAQPKPSKRSSNATLERNYDRRFSADSDLEQLRVGDGSASRREYPTSKMKHLAIGNGAEVLDGSMRGNSPEPNPHKRDVNDEEELEELRHDSRKSNIPLLGDRPHDENADIAAGSRDMLLEAVEGAERALVTRQASSDPPTARDLIRPTTPQIMDPDDEETSLLTRLDAPPSPAGPEQNKRSNHRGSGRGKNDSVRSSTGGYNTYVLDEEGHRQYNELQQQKRGSQSDDNAEDDTQSRRSVRGQDPPESGRGRDPKQSGSFDPPTSSSSSTTFRSTKYRHSRGSRSRESRHGHHHREHAASRGRDKRQGKAKDEKPQTKPKGILKKGDRPIPITQFGKPLSGTPQDSGVDDDEESGSDPDMTEHKCVASSQPTTTLQLSGGGTNNNDNEDDVKSLGTKSGLRSGKYASLNAAAAAKQNGDDTTSDDEETNLDYNDFSNYDDDATYEKYNSKDDDDDENTLRSIKSNSNEQYDRSKSHFLRTADLGLTQDTIFAEQFLDDPSSKPEPHYHHPSPHPPPGVQFHIDENWVCLDDGKGSYSPIAPQAVDALVAMGYRAACDPMMWTPTSKTRKYMTEKGLRFDDIPIPGPLDEGDGGPGDSTCLVWSGKFPHKYHGHEQPAIRSQGIVNMSPEDLVDLIMDSSRVSEYNKSSIGRADEVVLSDGTNLDSCPFSGQRKKKLTGVVVQGAKVVDGTAVFDSETDDEHSDVEEIVFDDDGRTITSSCTKRERRQSNFVGVTKLVRTKNKPPLVRKVLEFFTLIHCRALTDDQGGDGYIIVGRGITPASEVEVSKKGVMHSEILLNVHIIRRLRNTSKRSSGSRKKGSKGSSSKNVSTSGRKASKSDLSQRCLMINVNHLKSPMVPNMLAKKVGLSAALNFITDIRALTERESDF